MFGLLVLELLMCSSHPVPITDQVSKLDIPIINTTMIEFFNHKQQVRVDVTVGNASGVGEKALDFFLVDSTKQKIPNTLKEIMDLSPFIKGMLKNFFDSGSETLMITETISLPEGKEKINSFLGLAKEEYESGERG
jgi:hypothetical protein